MQALFSLVNCEGDESKVTVGKATCNLLASPESRTAAIQSGGLAVIKIIATMGSVELNVISAQTVIRLVQDSRLNSRLSHEPLVPVLVLILQQSDPQAFHYALQASACLCAIEEFKDSFINKGFIKCMVCAMLSGKLTDEANRSALARSLCSLSYSSMHHECIAREGNVMVVLHALYSGCGACDLKCAVLISIILRNISNNTSACEVIVEEQGIILMEELMESFASQSFLMAQAAVQFLHNLARCSNLHEKLIQQGLMTMLLRVASPGTIEVDIAREPFQVCNENLTSVDVYNIVKAIDLVSQTPSCREKIVSQRAVAIFTGLLGNLDNTSRVEMARSLASVAASKSCRETLVSQGAPQLVISLSQTQCEATQARSYCLLIIL